MLAAPGRDRIRTLRAIGSPRDPLALRLAVERTLGSTDLQPSDLPPDAIVCVRRLRIGAPPGEPGWKARIELQLRSLVPRAARPFREPVPGNAPMVVFFDQAELIACLARDWLRGDGDAWWWRGLFGEPLGGTLVRRVLLEAAMLVPAAMDLLFDAGLALDLVGALPSPHCEQVGAAVAAAFALPGWAAGSPAAETPAPPGFDLPANNAVAREGRIVRKMLDRIPCSRGMGRLSPPQRALFGTALALQRAPALARSPELGAALRRDTWWGMRDAVAHDPTGPESLDATATSPSALTAPDAPASPLKRGQAGGPPERTAPDLPMDGGAPAPAGTAWRPPARGPEATPVLAADAKPHREYVSSEFAGVLYLVNLALYLELYGDFTQPARPGLSLPLGDFLALVGHETCGAAFRDDPLWTLLAQLADREPDDPPGVGFVPPVDDPRLPTDASGQWLSGLLATLEARAASGLGMPEGGGLTFLCRRPGQVALSPTRLDAIYLLATHPLAIRMSGLDRNPGWVPAAGRVIEFHYV